eukprot:GHVL01019638.1.p1 GENE.GHVL01019638.1~~GHVL01019638.1.p1  ORF type:complete len:652 (+),score=64.44 GHVL01019638.1:1914-3869(+)
MGVCLCCYRSKANQQFNGVFSILKQFSNGVPLEDQMFHSLAAVFAGDSVIHEFYIIHKQNPLIIYLYVPHIANFVIYGPNPARQAVEAWMLSACESDFKLAHRFIWYIQSSVVAIAEESLAASVLSALHHSGHTSMSAQAGWYIEVTIPIKSDIQGDTGATTRLSPRLQHVFYSQADTAEAIFDREQAFIHELCQISSELSTVKEAFRNQLLTTKLDKLNAFLPAKVFIPFSEPLTEGEDTVDHFVLHIPTQEAMILSSKGGSVYHICVEIAIPTTLKKCKSECATKLSRAHTSTPPPSQEHTVVRSNSSPCHTNDISPALVQCQVPEFKESYTVVGEIMNMDDPIDDTNEPSKRGPKSIFGEKSWEEVQQDVRSRSRYGHLAGWNLLSMIVKTGTELRQEQIASQLLLSIQRLWQRHDLKLWLRPFRILATGPSSGLVETVPNAISIHSLKKALPPSTSLSDFFKQTFTTQVDLAVAKQNFMQSMAAYSIVCHVLSIRDRHNGNILIDSEGHVIHVDFGFILSNSPGNLKFEAESFKLTQEFLQLMDGHKSKLFRSFTAAVIKGFEVLRKNLDALLVNVDMLMMGKDNESLPCFSKGRDEVLCRLRDKFLPGQSSVQFRDHVHSMINQSIDHWRNLWYDRYQRVVVGILM